MPAGLTCIIPAWNEAPRIGAVLDCVCGHPLIDEVIVVDDGSTDGTADLVAARAQVDGVHLIAQPHNAGKSAAIATGLRAAQHRLILLVDSDLTGLSADHLTALIAPVLAGRADVSISLRRNAPLVWRLIGLDYISGERVVPRRLLPSDGALTAMPRFGLEVTMNALWIAARARIAVVPWPAVNSPTKYAKHGLRAGLIGELRMFRDIFATIAPHRALMQIALLMHLARPVGARGVARIWDTLRSGI